MANLSTPAKSPAERRPATIMIQTEATRAPVRDRGGARQTRSRLPLTISKQVPGPSAGRRAEVVPKAPTRTTSKPATAKLSGPSKSQSIKTVTQTTVAPKPAPAKIPAGRVTKMTTKPTKVVPKPAPVKVSAGLKAPKVGPTAKTKITRPAIVKSPAGSRAVPDSKKEEEEEKREDIAVKPEVKTRLEVVTDLISTGFVEKAKKIIGGKPCYLVKLRPGYYSNITKTRLYVPLTRAPSPVMEGCPFPSCLPMLNRSTGKFQMVAELPVREPRIPTNQLPHHTQQPGKSCLSSGRLPEELKSVRFVDSEPEIREYQVGPAWSPKHLSPYGPDKKTGSIFKTKTELTGEVNAAGEETKKDVSQTLSDIFIRHYQSVRKWVNLVTDEDRRRAICGCKPYGSPAQWMYGNSTHRVSLLLDHNIDATDIAMPGPPPLEGHWVSGCYVPPAPWKVAEIFPPAEIKARSIREEPAALRPELAKWREDDEGYWSGVDVKDLAVMDAKTRAKLDQYVDDTDYDTASSSS